MKYDIHRIFGAIPCTVVRSRRRKTSEILVDSEGINIRVPFDKNDQEIAQMLNNKKQWIMNKYLDFQTQKKHFKIRFDISYILQRTNILAMKIGVNPSKILVKHLKTRWGSASPNGIITINMRLLRAPESVIDYIIVHELCHLKIHGHNATYWNLVSMYMPDYDKNIEWLKKYGKYI